MQLSPQQAQAIDRVAAWLQAGDDSPQVFYLAGYAGTGKTTLALHLSSLQDKRVVFAAYTGKAASVLRKKKCPGAQTIHSLIYRVQPVDREAIKTLMAKLTKLPAGSADANKIRLEVYALNRPRFVLNDETEAYDCGLLVIDECSMVDEEVGRDLLSFGIKVLVLGDPGQLPPVKGTGYFTSREPDFLLSEIHRQAQDNPIINMATLVRTGRKLGVGSYGSSRVVPRQALLDYRAYSQVIVGRNATRKSVNEAYRKMEELVVPIPTVKEKLICLRNNRTSGLLNGTQWCVTSCEDKGLHLALEVTPWDLDEGKEPTPLVLKAHHLDRDLSSVLFSERKKLEEFDFGYAITCHKSQGSQWVDVFIQDESWCFREEASRWLYTALTRAEESVVVRK